MEIEESNMQRNVLMGEAAIRDEKSRGENSCRRIVRNERIATGK